MEMLANRLRKNVARLGPWAKRERVTAYRVYDRDIPEIPYFVDRYGDHALVSEFVTPVARRRTPDEREAEQRAVCATVAETLEIPAERLVLKLRERHVSTERQAAGSASHEFAVEEHGNTFLVNLDDYLDTGLFLDHRTSRKRIGAQAAGKRLLNLFCYTGAFSVAAAKGGAEATVSVDLSPTYLAWAERNFRANALDLAKNKLIRADALDWLRGSKEAFDLIVLDPPTMSRSKAGHAFDVQKAHPELIRLCLARLAPGGMLLFSTNFRQFRLDAAKLPPCDVREVTKESTPPDFREGLHRAYEIRSKQA